MPGIIKRDANLRHYPALLKDSIVDTEEIKQIVIGDLHGNALKLIYVLVEEGVLKLPEANYLMLAEIYNKEVEELTVEDLQQFNAMLNEAEVDVSKSLKLIGDELADRGNNDFLTLLVLRRLHKAKLDVEILLSNHSIEFIRDYERESFTGYSTLKKGQARSLANMNRLIEKELISEEDVRHLVEKHYKPLVKALSFSINEQMSSVTLYSHAPIGFETVNALADKLDVPYKTSNVREFIETIKSINEKISSFFAEKSLAKMMDEESYGKGLISLDSPLRRLVWNRQLGPELSTEIAAFEKTSFVHGHIGAGDVLIQGISPEEEFVVSALHTNLDSFFGKDETVDHTDEEGVEHFTLHSHQLSELQLYQSIKAAFLETVKLMEAQVNEIPLEFSLQAMDSIDSQFDALKNQLEKALGNLRKLDSKQHNLQVTFKKEGIFLDLNSLADEILEKRMDEILEKKQNLLLVKGLITEINDIKENFSKLSLKNFEEEKQKLNQSLLAKKDNQALQSLSLEDRAFFIMTVDKKISQINQSLMAQKNILNILDKSQFNCHLEKMLKKIEHKKLPEHISTNAAILCAKLKMAEEKLLHTPGNEKEKLKQFQNDCRQIISNAKPRLKENKEIKQFFANILNAVIMVGSGFISYAVTKRFRIFDVQSPVKKEINHLEKDLLNLTSNKVK